MVRDLLAHRAGLPCTEQQLTTDDLFDWNKMTSLLASQKPYWESGSAHGYHSYTHGFLTGELVQRVDPQHRSFSQFVRDELDPEFYIGVNDDSVEARIASLFGKGVRKNTSKDNLLKWRRIFLLLLRPLQMLPVFLQ